MAKQMSANRQLRTDFEFLKVASKRGESELLQALDNLEDAVTMTKHCSSSTARCRQKTPVCVGSSAAAVNHAHYRRAVGEPQHRRAAGQGVRPTPDKVRQAIFNSLGPWIEGASILELFAGSGALCLEYQSRRGLRRGGGKKLEARRVHSP